MTPSLSSSDRGDLQALVEEIHASLAGQETRGKVADYIPQLAKVDPSQFGIAVVTVDGAAYVAGDAEVPFSIQSISKVFTLTLALGMVGDGLWTTVGREPSGTAFNSIVQLEFEKGRPRNPFINAGAIAVADLILAGHQPKEAIGEIVQFVRFLAGDDTIAIDHTVARSETETGFRNFALAQFMRSFGRLQSSCRAGARRLLPPLRAGHVVPAACQCRPVPGGGRAQSADRRRRRFARPGAAHQRADADVRPL